MSTVSRRTFAAPLLEFPLPPRSWEPCSPVVWTRAVAATPLGDEPRLSTEERGEGGSSRAAPRLPPDARGEGGGGTVPPADGGTVPPADGGTVPPTDALVPGSGVRGPNGVPLLGRKAPCSANERASSILDR